MIKENSTWQLALGNLSKVEYTRPNYQSCEYCGKLFVPTKRANKYCNADCGSSMRRILVARLNMK